MPTRVVIVNNRYRIQEKLGQGGMGVVYKAHDRLTNQRVALKQVLIAMADLDFASRPSTDSDLNIALAEEFRTVASLRHPNIISVLDYGFTEDHQVPFFTMEYLDQPQEILQAARDLSLDAQVDLIIQLLQSLAYLHRHRIIHRDLKPDNVVVVDGQVKTLDFGLAVLRRESESFNNVLGVAGTFAYMAPEIFRESEPHRGSDLWAVGVMFYEILAGKHPFKIHNLMVLVQDLMLRDADIQSLDIPEPLAAVLTRLLHKDPATRYDNAFDVIDDLYLAMERSQPDESKEYRDSFIQAAKFTGRKAELTMLKDALSQAKSGIGRGILIGGESGVGKSRLLDELRTHALVEGFTVFRGQAVSGGGLPLQLWRDVIRRLILSVSLSDFDKQVLKEIVPDIETLLDEAIPDAPPLEGSAFDERLMLSIVGALKAFGKPSLLILEDLQWATTSLKVLDNLMSQIDQLPILVIASYRTEEAPTLSDQFESMTTITLTRLDDDAIIKLSASILGDAGTQPQLLDMLKRETEGNCFFLVEVIRALAEDAGRLANIGQAPIPTQIFAGGIQQVLQRRLNRLPSDVQNWLRVVALAGRQLDLILIERVSVALGYDDWQTQYLIQCSDANVLEAQEANWRFSHDKIREALLEQIVDEDYVKLHRLLAESLEVLYPDDKDYHEALLEHWHNANDLDKELIYLAPVADERIHIRGSHAEAQALLDRGLARLDDKDPRRVELLNLKSESFSKTGNYPLATDLADEAHTLAEEQNDQSGAARSLKTRGTIKLFQGDFTGASDDLDRSIAIYRELNDQIGIGKCLSLQGVVKSYRGQQEAAIVKIEQSLELFRELEYEWEIGFENMRLGSIKAMVGDSAAKTHITKSLKIMKNLGDQSSTAKALNTLGIIASSSKEYDESIAYFQQYLAIVTNLGERHAQAVATMNLGEIARKQQQFDQAYVYFEKGLALAKAIDNKHFIANATGVLGFLNVNRGDYDLAKAYLHEAISLARETEITTLLMEIICYAALYTLATGDAPRAAAVRTMLETTEIDDINAKEMLEIEFPASALEGILSNDALAAAVERGQDLDLMIVAQDFLDEFATANDDISTINDSLTENN